MPGVDLTGRHALVTGASSGIGEATALELARNGAHVIVTGRDPDRGDQVAAAIRTDGGTADFVALELDTVQAARTLAGRALELSAGQLDVLVNNAGWGVLAPTPGFDETAFDGIFATNLKVPFYLVGELAPAMAAGGSGAIVNVSSTAAELGTPGMGVYGASKAALNLLTKSWAAEFGPQGVRVNAVSPGTVRTRSTAPMGELLDQFGAQSPAGYVAQPEDIATVIAFLASDAASYMHGSVVSVDGGRTAV